VRKILPLRKIANGVTLFREEGAHRLFSGESKEEVRERLRTVLTRAEVIETILEAYQDLLDASNAQLVESPTLEIKVYLDARALDTSELEPEDQERLKDYDFPMSFLERSGGVVIEVPMSSALSPREN
jgi:hypothetical protein